MVSRWRTVVVPSDAQEVNVQTDVGDYQLRDTSQGGVWPNAQDLHL